MAENNVVYSYEGDATGVMDSLDTISEGIQGLIEDINALVDVSSGLGEFEGIFEEIAGIFEDVNASASEVTDSIAGIGAVADETSTQLADLQDAVDSLGGALAEDTSLIDGLNETIVSLQAQVDMLTASEDAATVSTDALSVSLEGLQAAQGPLMLISMAGIAAGASMYSMGSKAEDALNQVQALAGVGSAQMAQYTSQLEDQATQFGETLDQEAQGLFYVTSAGFSGAGAMSVLAQSVEDAKAGNVDLSVSANGLTTVLNAYGASADQASQYNDIMMTAVVNGKQTFSDFASSISKAAVEGHAAGISFNQVAAAEAALTDQGISARSASMDLSSMMKAMDSNIDATATSAKKMGLSFDESSYKTMSLQQQMQYLQQVTKGNQTEISTLVGGSAGLQAYNALMTVGSDGTTKFSQTLDAMKNSSGAAAQAFATSQDTIGAHWAKVQASLSVISYKALEALAPTINAVADAFGKAADFMSQHMDIVMPLLAGLAVMIGVILVSAVAALAVAIWSVASPFIIAGAIIGAVVAGIILVIEHWGDIVGWLKGVWAGTPGFFSGLWQNIQSGVSGVGNWLKDKWDDAAKSVVSSFDWLYNHNYYFKELVDFITKTVSQVTGWLKDTWKTIATDATNAWNVLVGKATQLWNEISQPFIHAWDQYIGPALDGLWNKIKAAWNGFVTNAENLGKDLIQHITGGMTSSASNVGGQVAGLLGFHNIVGVAQNVGANLQSWWKGVISGLANSPLGGAITKTLQSAFGQIGQQFGQIGQQLHTQLGSALSGVKPALDNVGNSFKLVWQQIQPGLQLVGGALTGAWKSLQGALSQIGQIISSSIGPMWKALQQQLGQVAAIVGGALSTAWKALSPIFAAIGGGVGAQLMNTLKVIGAILGGIVLMAIASVLGAIVGLAKAFATFIQGLSMVIGGVIKVFSGIIQIVSGVIAFIVDLFTGHFDKLGADLGTIWKGIGTMFSGIWDIIKGIFIAGIGSVLAFFSGFFSTIVTFFVSLGDSMGLHASAAVSGVVKWFQQLPGRAIAFVNNLVNSLNTILGGLGAKALTWAGDMINQFIQGIENGINGVGNAVQKIAGKIANFLHFSKPDMGPLVDVDTWMPDFMTLLSKGIDDNLDKLKGSALNIATTVSAAAPNAAGLPQGPNAAASGLGSPQAMQYLQQMAQGMQRQQLPQPSSSTSNAVTQQYNTMHFNGMSGQELLDLINYLQGQQSIYGQRGAFMNTFR
jgi:TP901 family phage tail tape measure protein